MSTSRFTIDDIKDALSTCSQLNNFTWNTNGLTKYLTFDYSDMTDEYKTKTKTAPKVINSKVLGSNDLVLMNWNTALFTNSGNSDMRSIFDSSSTITEWNSDLSSLTNGNRMFYNTAIESFNSDLSSLTNGDRMFAYCSAFESFNSDLSSLTDGTWMFAYCSALESFDSDLSSLTDGYCMFYNTNLASFNYDLSSLINGSYMFLDCTALTSFDSDLSSLTNGLNMFYYCTALTSFDSDLPKLTNGYNMFNNCTALTSFNSNLSSMTNGKLMFLYCTNLASFDSDLSSLTNGYSMFYYTALESFNSDLSSLTDGYMMFLSCTKLTSFDYDLSSMTNGDGMFASCTSLTSFNSDLPKLTSGWHMFLNCKLNTASVKNIASTINTVSSGLIHISIGNSTPNTEEETAFNTMVSKGWIVYVNGRTWTPTSSTNLTEEEEQSTPIPFYAKPIQVTEDVAEYIDANNNYYNIIGAQFIYGDDISTYGQFTSFEHAVEEISLSLGLTHKEEKE